MINYPLISIIITADCPLPQIEQSLRSLTQLKYPKDKLEFLLIMSPLRPVPKVPQFESRFSIIQFDCGIKWNKEEARFEGLSLAKGKYIQFMDACLNLKTKWLKEAITNFVKQNVIGVTGFVTQNEGAHNGNGNLGNPVDFINLDKLVLLRNGLFDKNWLVHLFDNSKMTSPNLNNKTNSEKLLQVATKMAQENVDTALSSQTNNPKVSNGFLSMLSKYIFVRSHI